MPENMQGSDELHDTSSNSVILNGSTDNVFDDLKPARHHIFVGRKDIIADILGYRNSGRSVWKPGTPTSFAIVGQEGIGKTSLLQLLDHRLTEISGTARSRYGTVLIPLYVDLNEFAPIDSRRVFFKIIGTLVSEQITETQRSQPKIIQPEVFGALEQVSFSENAKEILEALSAMHFKEGLATLNQSCSGMLRIICLIDGTDTILSRPWGVDLLKNLRHLIQDHRDIPDVLALVLAWTPTDRRQVAAVTKASGLEGNLTVYHLSSLSQEEVRELASRPGKKEWLSKGMNEDNFSQMVKAVFILGGGQPLLTQYLLKSLWERRQSLALNQVEGVIKDIESQASSNSNLNAMFRRWVKAFGDVEERIYLFLAARSYQSSNPKEWFVTEKGLVDNLRLGVKEDISFALDVLVSTGVITNSQESGFRVAGTVFREWFLRKVPQSYFQDISMLAGRPFLE